MTLQFALCNLHFEMLYSRCASLALREYKTVGEVNLEVSLSSKS
ncbi:hypothetical protein HS1_002263 [Candidatus Desulfofervidus auxilii]|uniref:Uncharacterized protein n=1 Tax=Desulfofervidus auxilii TaxID=1621989 RepID=A0A7U4QMF5_DESA2|nr:hypothetical protein HS1_002263 [Candidatus Desulfofervidus auxilii]CAD7781873.1 hypothetical protein DMNBHIDG_02811 [Candidatus Methanoperedenaceae archaeon GB37]